MTSNVVVGGFSVQRHLSPSPHLFHFIASGYFKCDLAKTCAFIQGTAPTALRKKSGQVPFVSAGHITGTVMAASLPGSPYCAGHMRPL